MNHAIFHNLQIEASTKKVFNAVSQPKHLDNWWTLKSSGKPELHAEYNLNFTDEYDWYCKVSKVKSDASIHFKMVKADNDWNPTTFGFDLEQTEKGTLVKFSHVDWQYANNHFKTASFCWAMLLNGLKNYLEKEIIVPFKDRN